MAVTIRWQPPLVLEARKTAQWETIIRRELGELDNPLDVSLHFEADNLCWKVEARPEPGSAAGGAAHARDRVVGALRAAGKPVV